MPDQDSPGLCVERDSWEVEGQIPEQNPDSTSRKEVGSTDKHTCSAFLTASALQAVLSSHGDIVKFYLCA